MTELTEHERSWRKDSILGILDYWLGIESCNCDSPLPIGGCLYCDLKTVRRFIEKHTREETQTLEKQ